MTARGRPRGSKTDNATISIRVTPHFRLLAETRAHEQDMSITEWARSLMRADVGIAQEGRTMDKTWTYEGYWAAVLGGNRSAEDVVREFDLDPTNRHTLSEWLGEAEAEAWRVGGKKPKETFDWHERALDQLQRTSADPRGGRGG